MPDPETPIPGPTGKFPDGKISDDDEGELAMTVGADTENRVVVIDFGTKVKWIGLPPESIDEFCELLQKHKKALL